VCNRTESRSARAGDLAARRRRLVQFSASA
jgi:hypothetical protein